MANFLQGRKRSSERRVEKLFAANEHVAIQAALRRRVEPLRLDLETGGLIAEIKMRSPRTGALVDIERRSPIARIEQRALAYASGGARAISVLTEPDCFGGSLDHLAVASSRVRALGVPVMRKDFLVHSIQVDEAAVAGASGVLLIARMLSKRQLLALWRRAQALGLFTLIELFDERDVRTLRETFKGKDPGLVGVNTRNLETLEVTAGRLARLDQQMPSHWTLVAESGCLSVKDIQYVIGLGYAFALVGTALMSLGAPSGLVRAMQAEFESGRRTCLSA